MPDRGGRELRRFRDAYRDSVETMFAAVTDLYAEHWHDFFHFAVFEHEGETWDEAFARTHARYVEALRVDRATRVLEVACGRGGFAEILAVATEGDVLGVDLSRAQLAHARKRRRPNLRFLHHDVMRLDELGETFDAVACMDAACYFPDKRRATEQLAQVVAPGGRLLLIDWCRQDGLNLLQEELVLRPFMQFWAVPSLETAGNYASYLEGSGLRVLAADDLNDRVRPNWELGYERAIAAVSDLTYEEAARMLWKAKQVGAGAPRMVKEQFAAALYIKAAYDAGFLRYTAILAERPAAV